MFLNLKNYFYLSHLNPCSPKQRSSKYYNIHLTQIPKNQSQNNFFHICPTRLNVLLSIFVLTINHHELNLLFHPAFCPVDWGCRIHQLLLCRGLRPPPPTSVLDMTLNNLMVRFKQCWSFGECGVPLHCHRSQVHSGPEWQHLIGPYLWVKQNSILMLK